jgi:hypothetical protein
MLGYLLYVAKLVGKQECLDDGYRVVINDGPLGCKFRNLYGTSTLLTYFLEKCMGCAFPAVVSSCIYYRCKCLLHAL